jgi:hypothetical protein
MGVGIMGPGQTIKKPKYLSQVIVRIMDVGRVLCV